MRQPVRTCYNKLGGGDYVSIFKPKRSTLKIRLAETDTSSVSHALVQKFKSIELRVKPRTCLKMVAIVNLLSGPGTKLSLFQQ